MEKRDYYEILGVERGVDDVTIKKAYKKLAIKFHPDRNPGDQEAEDRFKEASEAYQVLSDPEKRSTYDRFGHEGLRGQGFQGFSGFDDIFGSMGSIFEEFFGGFGGSRRTHNGPMRGRDLQYNLEIDLEEAAFGIEKSIEIKKYGSCLDCKGTGMKPGSTPTTCPACNGAGQVRRSSGFFSIQTTCSHCQGSGRIITDPCETCDGSGKVIETSHLNVKIPAGIETGQRLRIAGKGEEGHNGGPAGDLYVVAHIRPHDIFERHGQDLILGYPVSITTLILGGTVTAPSLDGDLKVSIPKGSQHEDIIRVKGKGIPHLKGYGRGDLLVQLQAQIPRKITKRQEELLREFSEIESSKAEKSESFFDKIKNFASGD